MESFSAMGLSRLSILVLLSLVLSLSVFRGRCDVADVSVKFLKAPHVFSNLTTATFQFHVLISSEIGCSDHSITCKIDDGISSDCGSRKVSYEGLPDGKHAFQICVTVQEQNCFSYNWTVDTVPPTAHITPSTSLTNALNVSVNISFSEPCPGEGGFGCSSVNACNLLLYGPGQVIPSSFSVLQPHLKYSLLVGLSPDVQYGRVTLVMDRSFCTDHAGNRFMRAENSTVIVNFDRRSAFVDLRTDIPEKLLQLDNEARTVRATNNLDHLKVHLYFSESVLNSSKEIQNSLSISQGALLPISGETLGNRRFCFQVANVSTMAIVTVGVQSTSIISLSGTSVSPIAQVTFLYDSQRPAVQLSTSNTRTREHSIPISIKFMKPVFGFNSSLLSISGGYVQSFHEMSRTEYIAEIQAQRDVVSVIVPQNVTGDVAGNRNLASNMIQVRHYSVPKISLVTSTFATACFLTTALAAGLLTASTASLEAAKAFSRQSSKRTSEPTRILFRIACHIQIFAFSRWLAVTLPVEYYEFARGLQWSIPYFSLPWENGGIQSIMVGSNSSIDSHSYVSNVHHFGVSGSMKEETLSASVHGLPLSPMEYGTFFESQSRKPEVIDPNFSNGWRDFGRSMFWLAVISGSLNLLHALLFLILKLRKKNNEKKQIYGALIFPRFELFLTNLALPCVCEASAAVIRGGTTSGVIVGILLLGTLGSLLLFLLLFLSGGITLGKLLQYKEVHQVGQQFHWYQELIRVTLGPGEKGQWTWKEQPDSKHLTMFGALFEDLRGPPKYTLSHIAGGSSRKETDRIIVSDDENEDAEAPFIQKLFGILRIYYTLLETIRRVTLGILAGAYKDDRSSRTPTIILLAITSFQLLFIVLKKPFIKKKVQLVEIISLSCQVGLFATCYVLTEKELSTRDETKVGILMLVLFLIGFWAQMVTECYALYKQTKHLDSIGQSFSKGLKYAFIGFILFFIPQEMSNSLEQELPVNEPGGKETEGETGSSTDRNIKSSGRRSSGMLGKPLTKQLREQAKASITEEGSEVPTDPSTSRTNWSENVVCSLEQELPVNEPGGKETEGETGSSTDMNMKSSGRRSSGTPRKQWTKQLGELAKACITKEGSEVPTDPSTSRTDWSENVVCNLEQEPSLNEPRGKETEGETGSSTDRNMKSSGRRSSGTLGKPLTKQLRELTKASITKEGSEVPTDPSMSRTNCSENVVCSLEQEPPVNKPGGKETDGETGSSIDRNMKSLGRKSSGTPGKPWTKQLRELAKACITKEGSEVPTDPSMSRTNWSENVVCSLEQELPVNEPGGKETEGETGSSTDRNMKSLGRSSGTLGKPWTKQLRELAKACITKEGSEVPTDPSMSRTNWSEIVVCSLEQELPVNELGGKETEGETGSSIDRNMKSSGRRSSSTPGKPLTKQVREITKASITKEGSEVPIDPSMSRTNWSENIVCSLEQELPVNEPGGKETEGETGSSTDRNMESLGRRSSGMPGKPWTKQLRKLAKACITKEESEVPSDEQDKLE